MCIKSFSSLHSLLIILLEQRDPGTILHSRLSYFPVLCVYVTQSLKRAAYRGMGNISVATPMKKKNPLPQPPHLSHREGCGLMSPSPSMMKCWTQIFTGFVQDIRGVEFESASAMSHPEDMILRHTSLTSGFYIL